MSGALPIGTGSYLEGNAASNRPATSQLVNKPTEGAIVDEDFYDIDLIMAKEYHM